MLVRTVAVSILLFTSAFPAFCGDLYEPTAEEMARIERVVLSVLPEQPLSKIAGLAAGKPYKSEENRSASWVCGFVHNPVNGDEKSRDNAFAGYLDLDSSEFFLAKISGSEEPERTNLALGCTAVMLGVDPETLFD